MAMSDEHKAALAAGRRQANAIKRYLRALGNRRPGRPVTPESLRSKIERIEGQIAEEADPLKRVDLHQAKIDAETALRQVDAEGHLVDLEQGFIDHAKAYSERKGIGYSAWREEGVPAATLKKAGIRRGG
jgi:hypothetical protein